MSLTPQFSQNKLKARLGLVKLRVFHPFLYKSLLMLLLVIVLGGAFLIYQSLAKQTGEEPSDDIATDIEIKTYSMNGEVLAVSPDRLEIKTDIIEVQNGVNNLVSQNKSIIITPQTEIVRITIKDKQVTALPATQKDIRIKKNIAIYSKDSPGKNTEITADKIEIIE